MAAIYDISQSLHAGMRVWPGDPDFQMHPVAQIRNGQAANVSSIYLGTHTGTHLDAPLHLQDSAGDSESIPLQALIGPARVFEVAAEGCIRVSDLTCLNWHGVTRALLKTSTEKFPADAVDGSFMYIHEDAATFLGQRGLALVGVEAPSVDAWDSHELPSHRILQQQGIAILEGVQLAAVPPGDYELFCLPLKLAGADGAPVRAVLRK